MGRIQIRPYICCSGSKITMARMAASAAVACALSASGLLCCAAAPSQIRQVAAVGQIAPGTSSRFGTFIGSPPSINIRGDVAFRAGFVNQGPEGIWAERGAAGLQKVAVNGDIAPGTGGSFTYFGASNPGTNAAASSLNFNDAGQIAFRATLGGSSSFNNDGLWLSNADGTLKFIAASGAPIPGGGSKNVVQYEQQAIALNQSGDVAFRGRYTTSFSNDAGVGSYLGSAAFITQHGAPIPGMAGRYFASPAYDGPLIAGDGSVYFKAGIATTAGGNGADNGIFRQSTSGIQVLAADGGSVPGLPGAEFDGIYPFDLAINSRGQVAFASTIAGSGVNTTNNVALFRIGTGGAIETVLRKGTQAPGLAPGIVFNSLSSPEMNAQGEFAFLASIGGPGVTGSNDETVWRQDSDGRFQLVAREGDAAADAPSQIFFGRSGFTTFSELSINSLGQVAFQSFLSGTGLGSTAGNLNINGLWATGADGALRSIAIAGQPFPTADGGTRVHGLILFGGGTGNDEGLPSGLSDAGYIAFRGYFTNAEAIYVSSKVLSVPEPNAAFVVAAAAALSLRGRRRAERRDRRQSKGRTTGDGNQILHQRPLPNTKSCSAPRIRGNPSLENLEAGWPTIESIHPYIFCYIVWP